MQNRIRRASAKKTGDTRGYEAFSRPRTQQFLFLVLISHSCERDLLVHIRVVDSVLSGSDDGLAVISSDFHCFMARCGFHNLQR